MIQGRRRRNRAGVLAFALCITIVSCPSAPPALKPFDRTQGAIEQRALIDRYFGGEDTRTPLPAARLEELKTRPAVSAAWWGCNPEDATASLQAAFDSGAAVVLVPRMDSPWICESLTLHSNTVLILEEGAMLLAKKGSFLPLSATLLTLQDVDDVTVWGYGAVIRMRKRDYEAPPYRKSEWRHAVQIRGSNRITLKGLTVESSGGDGVYLGQGRTRVTNTDILLSDLLLRDHHRQGMSIITAVNCLVENTQMSGTAGTPPAAGIDIEPNRPYEPLINCRLQNCVMNNNAGAGFELCVTKHTSSSAPFDIILDRCTVYGNTLGALVMGFQNGARGSLTLIDTHIYGIKLIPSLPGQLEFSEQ